MALSPLGGSQSTSGANTGSCGSEKSYSYTYVCLCVSVRACVPVVSDDFFMF